MSGTGSDTVDREGSASSSAIPKGSRKLVLAWAAWDWGASAYNTIVVSFVFATYLTDVVAKNSPPGALPPATWLSISLFVAGLCVAGIAPISGQRADAGGHRKRNLLVWTVLVMLSTLGLFFVRDSYSYFWLGLVLLAAGAVFQEFAQVSYNAMLSQISTPGNIGKVSGIGWGAGYIGGIVVLLLAYVAFVKPDVGLFGVTADTGLKYRALALVVVIWFAVFSLPTFLLVPEIPPTAEIPRVGLLQSYKVLVQDVRVLFRADPHAVWFLLASALYRDGLVAIFSLGGVLAVSVYGLSKADVVMFGVAANVVAAVGAFLAGIVEDRRGAKPVIMVSLTALVLVLTAMLFAHGPTQFWVLALILCLWVGPAQSASRTYLARLAPEGREGQMFGLYATTGRAVSFLAPGLFALFSGLFDSPRVGILGIAIVLLAGLIALSRVQPPPRHQPASLESEPLR
jgi:UMF1 family MFS transporter